MVICCPRNTVRCSSHFIPYGNRIAAVRSRNPDQPTPVCLPAASSKLGRRQITLSAPHNKQPTTVNTGLSTYPARDALDEIARKDDRTRSSDGTSRPCQCWRRQMRHDCARLRRQSNQGCTGIWGNFAGSGDKRTVDASASYLNGTASAHAIAAASPDALIVISICHPVRPACRTTWSGRVAV